MKCLNWREPKKSVYNKQSVSSFLGFWSFFFCIAARLRIVHVLPTEIKEFYFTLKVRDAYFWKE